MQRYDFYFYRQNNQHKMFLCGGFFDYLPPTYHGYLRVLRSTDNRLRTTVNEQRSHPDGSLLTVNPTLWSFPPSHLGNSSKLDCPRFGVGCLQSVDFILSTDYTETGCYLLVSGKHLVRMWPERPFIQQPRVTPWVVYMVGMRSERAKALRPVVYNCFCPFRAKTSTATIPRALPWANGFIPLQGNHANCRWTVGL